MVKITLAVSKCYKNTGRFRFHRKNTKPAWKHYFFDSVDRKFCTEWIDSVTAQFLKLKKWHLRKFICPECYTIFSVYIKNDRMEAQCPNCENE